MGFDDHDNQSDISCGIYMQMRDTINIDNMEVLDSPLQLRFENERRRT